MLHSLFFLGTRTGLASQSRCYTSLIKPASNNLAISFFYYILLVLGETSESLLNGLGVWVQKEFVLNQFHMDSWHVSRLPCKDVSIFPKEFDKREFLFGIQGVAYVSNLGRFLHRQWYLLAECVLRLDGRFGSLGVRNDWVQEGRGLGQGLFQLSEFYGCCQSVGHLRALLVIVIGLLDVSPDGDDSTRSWHL
jgi:hypothetical protein